MEKRLDLIFGSDSDEAKVLPGIVKFTIEHPSWQVRVHYASADNTPGKVKEVMQELAHLPVGVDGRHVYISGAGMSNVLTGVAKTHAAINELVLGIPITDSKTKGLSSLLSTSEKPPLNPVLTVGLDDTYAALNIASRFLECRREDQPVVVLDNRDNYQIEYEKKAPWEAAQKIMEALKGFNQPFELRQIGKISEDDIVVAPFYNWSDDRGLPPQVDNLQLRDVDGILTKGTGIQIAVYSAGEIIRGYEDSLKGTQATGIVSIGSYKNAAHMAVILSGNELAMAKILAEKQAKTDKLYHHKGLSIVNGAVEKL